MTTSEQFLSVAVQYSVNLRKTQGLKPIILEVLQKPLTFTHPHLHKGPNCADLTVLRLSD